MSRFTLTGFGDEIAADLDIQLKVMKKNGLSYLEMRNVDGIPLVEFPLGKVREIKRKLDAGGFRLSCIGSPLGKIGVRDDFGKQMDLFKHTLEIADVLQAPYLRIFSFYIPSGETPKSCRGEVMSRLNAFCEAAEGAPVRLLHENELGIYGDTPERCLDIVETLGFGRIGAIFDPANFINHEEKIEVYPAAWNLLKRYVQYLHIKDSTHAEKKNLPSGYGEGHIADILRDLDARGYEGFLSVEPHLGTFDGFERLEKRIVDPDMPKGGPQTFTIAVNALKRILAELQGKRGA